MFISINSFFLQESSKLYAFGANGDGQLGVEGVEDDRISTPTCVTAANKSKIKILSAGTYHSAFLTGNNNHSFRKFVSKC